MISHQYQCIFVEVPKTGSTSIRAILGIPPKPHMNIWQMKYELENYWTHHGGMLQRLLASCYLLLSEKKRNQIGNDLFQRYFKFGFVRNPWDRTVSLYERREGLQLRDKMTFEEFVSWISMASSTCIHPVPHRNQLDWFVDPHGNVIVDFIGKFECLESHWALVAAKLGIAVTLKHENRNPRRTRHYSEYYSPKTREIVARKFQTDIEFFGYDFEGASAPQPFWFDTNQSANLAAAERPAAKEEGPRHKEKVLAVDL